MFHKYFAEFLGTCFFVFVILTTNNSLAIGAALALVIMLLKSVSGGYANPVVSVVMASMGQMQITDLFPYILAQIFGGLTALELYKRFYR